MFVCLNTQISGTAGLNGKIIFVLDSAFTQEGYFLKINEYLTAGHG